MRIPENRLHYQHIAAYGAGGLELTPGIEEPGCPRRYRMKYVESGEPYAPSAPLSYGSALHECLYLVEEEGLTPEEALRRAWRPELGPARYSEALHDLEDLMSRGGPLTQLHTVAVEQFLTAFLYEDEDFGPIEYGGVLDWIGVDGSLGDEPVPTLFFSDYKTNRAPPSQTAAEEWRQGKGYAWLLRENAARYLPDADRVRIVGYLDAIKWYALRIEYDDDELDEFKEWAISVARTILRDKEGRAKLNPGCSFCAVRHDCPAFRQLPGIGETLAERMSRAPLDDRVRMMHRAQDVIKKLEMVVDDTTAALVEKVLAEGGPVNVGGKTWEVEQTTSTVVDPVAAFEVMGDDFWKVAKVSVTGVRRWLKSHPEVSGDALLGKVPGRWKLVERKDGE